MNVKQEVYRLKEDSPILASSGIEKRNQALRFIAELIREHSGEIFAENEKDLKAAKENHISSAVMKRLKFDEGKLEASIKGIEQLILLLDPLNRTKLNRQLDEGLVLKQVTCPIGVIGVIFEARPDALIQISSLCLKSGNCAVLKGGKETVHTNRILFQFIREGVIKAGLPQNCVLQVEQHNEIDELLECDDCVDLLIPRGSNAFVQYIMNHTRIPVMGHADGICHIYVDKEADFDEAIRIIVDAKTQYTAACNAVETILVHEDIADEFLPKLSEELKKNHVEIKGTRAVTGRIGGEPVEREDFKEYLELIVSVDVVDSIDAAIRHINTYGSHHTDAIVSKDLGAAEYFMNLVDSAGVYHNCSTRFADGFRYGFGAEVGISTGKIHARGPVGLDGLVTYKYKLFGSGQTVDEYASGQKQFHFMDQ